MPEIETNTTWDRTVLVVVILAIFACIVAGFVKKPDDVLRWYFSAILLLLGLLAFREHQAIGRMRRVEQRLGSSGIRKFLTTGSEGLKETEALILAASTSIQSMVHFSESPHDLLRSLEALGSAVEKAVSRPNMKTYAVCTLDITNPSRLSEYEPLLDTLEVNSNKFHKVARHYGGEYEVRIRFGPIGPNFSVYDQKRLAIFFPSQQVVKQFGFIYDEDLSREGGQNLAEYASDFFTRVWANAWSVPEARRRLLEWRQFQESGR